MKKLNGYRQAVERPDISRPTGKADVFLAYDTRTDAYLGVVVHQSAYRARERAADLYAVPIDFVLTRRRSP